MPFLDSQIDPRDSSQLMTKAFPARKQYGQIGDITAIAHCHQIFWQKCGNLLWTRSSYSNFLKKKVPP
jgi:hypothetical protein